MSNVDDEIQNINSMESSVHNDITSSDLNSYVPLYDDLTSH